MPLHPSYARVSLVALPNVPTRSGTSPVTRIEAQRLERSIWSEAGRMLEDQLTYLSIVGVLHRAVRPLVQLDATLALYLKRRCL